MHEQLKLSNQLCFRLYTLTRLVTQAYRPLLSPLGLTYPQYLVMMVLWEQDDLTVGDIVHRLQLDTNTVTPLLQRMEREGLVARRRGQADGRQTLVSLTAKGRRLEARAASVPGCLSQCWQGNDFTAEELACMVRVVDKLIDGMK